MLKKIFIFTVLVFSLTISAQQNEEFRNVKKRFDYHKLLVINAFKKEFDTIKSDVNKAKMHADFVDFMAKMDSVQNSMYIGSLIKVKNSEDLAKISGNPESFNFSQIKGNEKTPQYPGGIDNLRKEIGELFYAGNIISDQKQFRSNVNFVVEKDGYISTVEATGDSVPFNKQAIIAVYLLPEKFSPASVDGVPVRYRYTLPIILNLE